MNGPEGLPINAPPREFSERQAMGKWLEEIVPYGIFTTDRNLRITSWNEWLVSHGGLPAPEVVGRLLTDVFPDLEPRRLRSRYTRALQGEISILSVALHKYLLPFPVAIPGTDLPQMLQTARIAPLPEAGQIVGTITIIEDVTQRELHAGILHRQQEVDRLLSSALATLLQADDPAEEMGGIFGTVKVALGLDAYACYLPSPDGTRLLLSSAVGITPRPREAIADLPLSDADRAALIRSGAAGAVIAATAEITRLVGFSASASFPLMVGERILGLVLFGNYQRQTVAPADTNALDRIARYVAIALDRHNREQRTESASRAKDDFLAALSHELRTPLNPVLLMASDSAANPAFSDPAREVFRVIEKNALLEARLIDDLLDLTSISHGKLALEMQALDVTAVLRDALGTVRPEMDERGLSVVADFGPGCPRVLGDAGRLQQVFWNVLKNAVKFTLPGGKISVACLRAAAGTEAVVRITDTGIGMDPAELTRVFGAFAQGDHAQDGRSHRFGGLGLGLAISRKLTEMHGGRIEAASEGKGRGSTFTIHLPIPPGMEAGTLAEDRRKPAPPHGRADAVTRILVVEDNEPTRAALERLLKRRGYEVVVAATARSAREEAGRKFFDLVLSDIGLPDSDGFTLMRHLRDTYGLKGIALTGFGMEEDMARSREAGFKAHLTKPISVKTLNRALEQIFNPDHA